MVFQNIELTVVGKKPIMTALTEIMWCHNVQATKVQINMLRRVNNWLVIGKFWCADD